MPASKVGQPSSSSCVGLLMMSSRPTESIMTAHSFRVRFMASARFASDFLWKPRDPHCNIKHTTSVNFDHRHTSLYLAQRQQDVLKSCLCVKVKT